ncbi:hypothetical protein [Candidatus Odyssella thessalonicensis]|uniref:hypothetical protein n=1 Tax=Candidatus Odyssella thessalonicensis TaxID=84647 RepID=UPI000225C166|nr:hypothetical protein [Candidatus Odyssella thessalonicensis]
MIFRVKLYFIIPLILLSNTHSYDWSIWPGIKRQQFGKPTTDCPCQANLAARYGTNTLQQSSQFTANSATMQQGLQNGAQSSVRTLNPSNANQLSKSTLSTNAATAQNTGQAQSVQNAQQQGKASNASQTSAQGVDTGAAALAGLGAAALAAFGSMKNSSGGSSGNSFSNFAMGGQGVITKNFSCTKSALECQNEWNALVSSIESNPQYQVLTKQMSCGGTMPPGTYPGQMPANMQGYGMPATNYATGMGTPQSTSSSLMSGLGSIARAF